MQAWAQYLRKDIDCLEKVQRSGTKMVEGLSKRDYEDSLMSLGLTSLEKRRQRGDLIETFELLTGRLDLDPDRFFQLAENQHGLRGHSLKLFKPRSSNSNLSTAEFRSQVCQCLERTFTRTRYLQHQLTISRIDSISIGAKRCERSKT